MRKKIRFTKKTIPAGENIVHAAVGKINPIQRKHRYKVKDQTSFSVPLPVYCCYTVT